MVMHFYLANNTLIVYSRLVSYSDVKLSIDSLASCTGWTTTSNSALERKKLSVTVARRIQICGLELNNEPVGKAAKSSLMVNWSWS